MRLKPILTCILLIAAAMLLSASTFVFGAIPMRAVRLAYGRLVYWGGFALASAGFALVGMPAYAILMFAMVVVVGVYTDVEEHGGSVFISGLLAILASLGMAALSGGLWIQRSKIHLMDEVRAIVATIEANAAAGRPNFNLNAEAIIQQLPSIAVIAVIAALALALICERRALAFVVKRPMTSPASEARLSSFRIPDVFIWLTIAALFGAFVKHGHSLVETVSVNSLNVLVILFFFQGLAVVSHAFRAFKVAPFWQGLWYIVLVLQLFLIVSLVGFVDFWIEFRERLARKSAATNKSI